MIARPVELFFFHDLVLTVVEAEQSRYVALKPIVEMLGLSWKRASVRRFLNVHKTGFICAYPASPSVI